MADAVRSFADEGSAYQVAVSALRAAAADVDGVGPATGLTVALQHAAGAESFADFAVWARARSKRELANLSTLVTDCAAHGDAVAHAIVCYQAERLAAHVAAGRARLSLPENTPVYLNGGLFANCATFRTAFESALKTIAPGLCASFPELRGPRAVLELCFLSTPSPCVSAALRGGDSEDVLSPTERNHAEGRPLDALSAHEIVERMNSEDTRTIAAVAAESTTIAAVIEQAAHCIQSGGRLIYVGAGTSGRLGVLDASECPPTFGVSPDRVIGIIAGGERALRNSVEGAEDDVNQAKADVSALSPPLSRADIVIGVAASGATPYVRAALDAATASGAHTTLLCCNPAYRGAADHVIALDTGPEVLPGSTRPEGGNRDQDGA